MIELVPWLERTWRFDLPVGAFPALLERLRGTAARGLELMRDLPLEILRDGTPERWSPVRHLGHLDDLHDLDLLRLDELLSGAVRLTPADPENRRTRLAAHDEADPVELLEHFGRRRAALVARLERLTPEQVSRSAEHPRLRQPIRLIDWAEFVADHDDHHLACAREAIRRGEPLPGRLAGPSPPRGSWTGRGRRRRRPRGPEPPLEDV